MSVLHCPLCIGLAVLSILRAVAHLALMGLRLAPAPGPSERCASFPTASVP